MIKRVVGLERTETKQPETRIAVRHIMIETCSIHELTVSDVQLSCPLLVVPGSERDSSSVLSGRGIG